MAPSLRGPGTRGLAICLEGASRYSFGSRLSEARRYFMLQVIRGKLASAGKERLVTTAYRAS